MIQVVMVGISFVSMSIRWNDKESNYFKASKVIQQEDPISLYRFVLCMEKLSHLILEATESGKWVGIKVVRRGPSISHLMFAGKATTKKVYHVKDILDHFWNKSGQHVSIDKLEYSSRVIQLLE